MLRNSIENPEILLDEIHLGKWVRPHLKKSRSIDDSVKSYRLYRVLTASTGIGISWAEVEGFGKCGKGT